jgi:MSHA biogenesis protein MshP
VSARISRSGTQTAQPREGGFSLVAAIFLIVVLATLAGFAVRVAMSQYQGGNLELLEARAQAAADSGIEYAANRALRVVGWCAAPTSPPPLRLNTTGLRGYVIQVSCVPSPGHMISPPPAGTAYTVYELTSTATYGTYGQPGYVSRTVRRNVTLAPP